MREQQVPGRFSPKSSAIASLLIFLLAACAETQEDIEQQAQEPRSQEESTDKPAPRFSLHLTGIKAHPTSMFTQGLFFWDNHLYESSGLWEKSLLIKYNADASRVSVQRRLADTYFAEGATLHNNRVYQLTWKAGKMLVYQGTMLTPVEADGFEYEGEGWGLTSDGSHLWLSDGTDELRVMDNRGNIVRRLLTTYQGQTLDRLNELEWVNGWLLANRWHDHHIYAINPTTGEAEAAFNLRQIAEPQLKKGKENVINGIAWNPDTQKLWITGKYWDRFYLADIRLPAI